MELHAITKDYAIYTNGNGGIYAETITQGARAVLNWYYNNIPANQN